MEKKKTIHRLLNKGVEEILPSKEELEKILLSDKKLRVYQGFDPTAPTLHIGHTVAMRKLEDFRKLGHKVFFLIGDFTAMIGDPSDKMSTRKKLEREEVKKNLKNYKEQASKIIDIDNKDNPVEVVFNHDWLSKLTLEDIIELSSHFTVQQMIKRDMFQKRLEKESPIYLNEFLYPLMQGYDSVYLDVDVEVCGNDQMFNALAGRQLCQEILNKNKFVLSGKLLTTADGSKMGKSEGNMIKLSDKPNDIYGKVMSFPDEAIVQGFELLTNLELEEIEEIEKELKDNNTNPMELKKRLAFEITAQFNSKAEAEKAQKYFENVFQKKEYDTEIDEIEIDEKSINIIDLLYNTQVAQSKSEARRLIDQSAVNVDGEKIKEYDVVLEIKDPITLKVGKKVFKIISG